MDRPSSLRLFECFRESALCERRELHDNYTKRLQNPTSLYICMFATFAAEVT
jgi:hypothetical protein